MPSKLLLADDSVTIQRVIELTFADEDVDVFAVGDGRQAIERIRTDQPDIVLADVGMPEQDGYEVAAFIKNDRQLAHIPVLLLTGAFEPVDEARARAVGCDGVLVKPFEPQLVISRVRELLSDRKPAPAPDLLPVEPLPSAPAAGDRPQTVDDYFERLDAAFASMGASPRALDQSGAAPAPASASESWTPEVVTNSGQPLHAAAAASEAAPLMPAEQAPGQLPALADAFAALLAAEQGHAVPTLHTAPLTASPLAVSDELIDEIARRVIARMGDDAMRRAVLDAAERLVRDEIDRIKAGAANR